MGRSSDLEYEPRLVIPSVRQREQGPPAFSRAPPRNQHPARDALPGPLRKPTLPPPTVTADAEASQYRDHSPHLTRIRSCRGRKILCSSSSLPLVPLLGVWSKAERIARPSSCGPAPFSTTRWAPARCIARNDSPSSPMLRATTLVSGWVERMWRVASAPSIRGIRQSITTTSGLSFSTCSRDFSPSSASPTTSMSLVVRRTSLVMARKLELSSTKRTRIAWTPLRVSTASHGKEA